MDHEAFYNWACENSSAKEYADIMRAQRVSGNSMRRPDIVDDLTSFRDENRQLIPLLAAKDIVAAFSMDNHYGSVAIYWDIENVPPPRGVTVADAANCLVKRLKEKHGEVREFKTYVDPNVNRMTSYDILSLADCKVDVIYAAHHGRKEVVDKLIIVDALWYAQETRRLHPSAPLPTICIVSGDSDFSPLISQLNRGGFHTICVSGDTGAKLRSIHQQARAAYTWSQLGLRARADSVVPPSYGRPPGLQPPPPAYVTPPTSGPSNMTVEAPSSPHVEPIPQDDESDVMEVETTMLDEELHDPIDDLREAILSCQADAAGRVRRSQAGVYFQKNSVSGIKFSEVVAMAVEKGVVEKGGVLGGAWVKLVSQKKLYLMVVANGTYPTNIPGCIKSLSYGNAHRYVYAFNDTAAMATFTITYFPSADGNTNSNAADEQEIWFREINDVAEIEKCYVDGTCRRLSEFVQNRGYAYLLGHPNRTGRMCTFSTCHLGSNCTYIHLRGATPSAGSAATAASPSQPPPNYPHSSTPAPTTESIQASLECLVSAIRLLSDKADAEGHILRAVVGSSYKGIVPFKEITKIAEERGLVALGGVFGTAWIKLLQGDN